MITIHCLGMKCPLPIIELTKVMRREFNEKNFLLESDDVATLPDLNAWSRMTGHFIKKISDHSFEITRKS